MPPRRPRSQHTVTPSVRARENAGNSTPMMYHHIETPLESPSLSTSEEEAEPIAKIARRAVDINKLTYPLSVSMFIDKEHVSSHSRSYILDEYSFFLEKRKLDKAVEEETKKHGLELEMKSSIASVYASGVCKVENDVWETTNWYKVEDLIRHYFTNNYKKVQVELVFKYTAKKSECLKDDNVVEIHSKRGSSDRTPVGSASKKRKIIFLAKHSNIDLRSLRIHL